MNSLYPNSAHSATIIENSSNNYFNLISILNHKTEQTRKQNRQLIFSDHIVEERGAVVEWLEQLDYDAESRRKGCEFEAGLRPATTGRLSHSRPSSEWVPFSS